MSATTTEAPLTATAAATSAASGMDSKAKHASLHTPVSASYPSELRSPHPGTPAFLKREEAIKTPITPPSAYMDFLKTLSPAMLSPPTTSGSISRFPSTSSSSFSSVPSEADPSELKRPITKSPPTRPPPLPLTHPSLSRNPSTDSTATTSSVSSTTSTSTTSSTTSTESIPRHPASARLRPESPRIIIPPSPFTRPVLPGPNSARTPRRTVPPSPLSASTSSATPWSASFSPRSSLPPPTATREREREVGRERSANVPPAAAKEDDTPKSATGKVCVRQVVTRTVTYCRPPNEQGMRALDPAPRGKRRRIEVEGSCEEDGQGCVKKVEEVVCNEDEKVKVEMEAI